MSHFIVAVFARKGQDWEELLAPYNEQDESYMEFQPCDDTPEELQAKYQEVKAKYSYKSFEEFMEQYYGYYQGEDDLWGYFRNPNAKWDWYQEGGRWSGYFRTKNGEWVNCGIVANIDFSPDKQVYDKAIRFWEVVVDGDPLRGVENQEDFWTLYKPEYYRDQYGTKEKYAMQEASVIPWAFVTADGDWIEKGRMGWWAMNDATKDSRAAFADAFKKYVAEHPDLYVIAVDCHI